MIRFGQVRAAVPTPLTYTHLLVWSVQRNPGHHLRGSGWLLKLSFNPVLVTNNSALLSTFLKLTSTLYHEDPKEIYKRLLSQYSSLFLGSSWYLKILYQKICWLNKQNTFLFSCFHHFYFWGKSNLVTHINILITTLKMVLLKKCK